ncbi:MAG: hypothetical protein IKF99_17710 [Oscillospiraceae bacterium]|nr:hypothetical protein [Oscillospiraceae bacterium]
MRRKSNVSFGPGAASLILIVVILSMAVLGMLALMNARNDSKLSKRSIEVVAAGFELNDKAERSVAELDAVLARCAASTFSDDAYLAAVRGSLPDGMLMGQEDRIVSWELTDGLRTLSCAVEVLPQGEKERLRWREHRLTAVTEDVWN